MGQNRIGSKTNCGERQEQFSRLLFGCSRQWCQHRSPWRQKYLGTRRGGRTGPGQLAVDLLGVTLGVAVGGATKLVGYVHQISGECLLVPLSGVNIDVSAVHHDNPPFGNSHQCPFLRLLA
jgi:hypothetical protein